MNVPGLNYKEHFHQGVSHGNYMIMTWLLQLGRTGKEGETV